MPDRTVTTPPNGRTPAPLPARDTSSSTYPGSSLYRRPAATAAAPKPAGGRK